VSTHENPDDPPESLDVWWNEIREVDALTTAEIEASLRRCLADNGYAMPDETGPARMSYSAPARYLFRPSTAGRRPPRTFCHGTARAPRSGRRHAGPDPRKPA
jgi:hypothetical protein